MATESPMRMVEGSANIKWFSSKDATSFGSPCKSLGTEEYGFSVEGLKVNWHQAGFIPGRSGSAPPSMEGSLAAIGNSLALQNSSPCSKSGNLSNALRDYNTNGQQDVDLPSASGLPMPNIAQGNQYLVNNIPGFSYNQKSYLDKCGDGSLHVSPSSLSTRDEEHEDESSHAQTSENLEEKITVCTYGQRTGLLSSRHKSLVDLIQEDFPRTPSPVYNQSNSSHATAEDSIACDVNAISMVVSSINILCPPESVTSSTTTGSHEREITSMNVDARGLILDGAPLETSSSQCSDATESPDELNNRDVSLKDDKSINGTCISGPSRMEHRMRVSDAEINRQKQEHQYNRRNRINDSCTPGIQFQVQGVQAPVLSQRMNESQGFRDKLPRNQAKFSSVQVQPPLPSSGLTSPFYATPAGFMTVGNPFYPNFEASQLVAPPYSLGGYSASSTFYPPYMAGYIPHNAVHLSYDMSASPSLNSQTNVSSGQSVPHQGDFQHLSRYHGQHGSSPQTSFIDPLHMQYYSQSVGDAYSAGLLHSRLVSRNAGGQVHSSVSLQDTAVTPYIGDQKFKSLINGGPGISNPINLATFGRNHYGNSSGAGVMMQFPSSPLASPILPSSPVGGINPLVWKDEKKFSQGSNGNGQRGISNFDDSTKHPFLQELKSINLGKFELSDIAGCIVQVSIDQHGSRFIQQKLETCAAEEKMSVFKEVLPHASKLMTDVFGNYVIQKFFEYGTPEQRMELADQLSGQMLPLSLQMYGCRVIQKALEVIELDQKTQLVHELDGHVLRCVRDQNGNHVIQKCIECVPMEKIGFIISAFQGHVSILSTHTYGCRVIQRILEQCSDERQIQCIVDEILESAFVLVQDQYGNYVTQHVLERGKPHERSQIVRKLTGKIVQMSQHKYASNVIEKCLEYGNASERELLIEEIMGPLEESNNLLAMMKDQYANYVIQKVLETSNDKHREILLNQIRLNLDALKKYTYGKHIVARFEQISSAENQALDS